MSNMQKNEVSLMNKKTLAVGMILWKYVDSSLEIRVQNEDFIGDDKILPKRSRLAD